MSNGNHDQDMDEALKSTLPEAPASATIRVWIKGYGTLFTMREEDAIKLAERVEKFVEYSEKKGWKNTWDKEEPIKQMRPGAYITKDEQAGCAHPTFKILTAQTEQNRGRQFKTCATCKKFLGWLDTAPKEVQDGLNARAVNRQPEEIDPADQF